MYLMGVYLVESVVVYLQKLVQFWPYLSQIQVIFVHMYVVVVNRVYFMGVVESIVVVHFFEMLAQFWPY